MPIKNNALLINKQHPNVHGQNITKVKAVQNIFKTGANCIIIMCKLCANCVQTVFKLCANCEQAVYKLVGISLNKLKRWKVKFSFGDKHTSFCPSRAASSHGQTQRVNSWAPCRSWKDHQVFPKSKAVYAVRLVSPGLRVRNWEISAPEHWLDTKIVFTKLCWSYTISSKTKKIFLFWLLLGLWRDVRTGNTMVISGTINLFTGSDGGLSFSHTTCEATDT